MPNTRVWWKKCFLLSLCLFFSVYFPIRTFSTLLVNLAPKSNDVTAAPILFCFFCCWQLRKNIENGTAETSLRFFFFRDDFKTANIAETFIDLSFIVTWTRTDLLYTTHQHGPVSCSLQRMSEQEICV